MGNGPEQLFGPDERRFFDSSSAVEDFDPADGRMPEVGATRSTSSARDRARTDRQYNGKPLRRPTRSY